MTQYMVRLAPEQEQKIKQIAFDMGYKFGKKGSIAKLLKAIANDQIIIFKKVDYDKTKL